MTTEEINYIHQLVEDGIGATEDIMVRFRHRFPGKPYIWDDIAQVKKSYLFRRYGLLRYQRERVEAVRIFEASAKALKVTPKAIQSTATTTMPISSRKR